MVFGWIAKGVPAWRGRLGAHRRMPKRAPRELTDASYALADAALENARRDMDVAPWPMGAEVRWSRQGNDYDGMDGGTCIGST